MRLWYVYVLIAGIFVLLAWVLPEVKLETALYGLVMALITLLEVIFPIGSRW